MSTAEVAMATQQLQEANLFSLSCAGEQVSYSKTSITGQPLFSYSGSKGDINASGEEIDTLDTALGTEVTAVIESVPDLRTVTITLVVPSVLLSQGDTVEFDTIAVFTTTATTIAGPPAGAAQTYEVIELHGEAQFVIS
jgi:hypothetical protein